MSEGEIWIKLFGPASLIISESFPLMWKFNVAELNFGNATCSISMSPATGSLLLCEEVLNLQLFTCTPGDRKDSCFLLVLGVSRVWCFDFAVASHKCCWPSDLAHDDMPWAYCLWQGLFQVFANDEHTHENIPTFLCSGDGHLASNEVQASSGK